MSKTAVIQSKDNPWADSLCRALWARHPDRYCFAEAQELSAESANTPRVLYIPNLAGRERVVPNLHQAEAVLRHLAQLPGGALVLVSSALIYGIGPNRRAFATEDYSPPAPSAASGYIRTKGKRICDQWLALETLARNCLNRNVQLTILRPAAVLPSPALFSRALLRYLVPTLPGHDPNLQFLNLNDLADAIDRALECGIPGIFNIAPDDAVPLHAAVRIAGGRRIPILRTLQRLTQQAEALEYLRYPWTISTEKAKRELGFSAAKSSVQALAELKGSNGKRTAPQVRYDDFGMDKDYIRFYGRTLFRFLSDFYWRIESRGLEHVPREGRGVLVGVHRGFMPWDGCMALHLVVQKTGRYPRFLTHPGLLKFPFLANFMTKLGGVIAWKQSADRVLAGDELLGIFPEGIQGAFTYYKNAYQLKEFGRDAYVKMALRNRAPIVPFVTVGSAEIFPIFGKIKSRTWTRYTDWPCLPLTPTFPLLPVPLPSKWHTQFLPPMHIEKQYPPEAEQDSGVVKAISLEVRTRMQQAIDEMLARRRSIYHGSIFEPEADESLRQSGDLNHVDG
jgi:1-acyl-sn-glycerol-3-phosphate acyltransferase/nucleoside-diphosphate-sugar epimerase